MKSDKLVAADFVHYFNVCGMCPKTIVHCRKCNASSTTVQSCKHHVSRIQWMHKIWRKSVGLNSGNYCRSNQQKNTCLFGTGTWQRRSKRFSGFMYGCITGRPNGVTHSTGCVSLTIDLAHSLNQSLSFLKQINLNISLKLWLTSTIRKTRSNCQAFFLQCKLRIWSACH